MVRYAGAQPAIYEDQSSDENNFSEEEEALYVAANDSEIDSDPQAKRHGQDLELSNVAVFRKNLENPHHHAFHPLPAAGWPSQAFIPQDDRTLILFDLNGVLVHHSFNGRTHKHFLRPGAEQLLRLTPHYRLGIYSSATQPTVQRAMAKLHEDLVAALPDGETPPPEGFFEVVLCRDHCVLAKEVGVMRRGGKPWDTVKPLAQYFQDLTQVVLVDDSPHKSLPDEVENMLVMPVWEGPDTEAGLNDAALPALVDGFVEAMVAVQKSVKKKGSKKKGFKKAASSEDAGPVATGRIQDIRPIVDEISRTLMILYPPPSPSATEEESEDGMLHRLSLNPKNRKSALSPPPGLPPPPPPHLLRSSLRNSTTAAATSIGAEAINHHAALYFFVLVKLKQIPAIPGATLFDINTLLQRRSMAAFTTLFKKSAKTAIKNLVTTGMLAILDNTSTERGTRYSLNKLLVKLPSSQRLAEIESYAQSLSTSSGRPKKPTSTGGLQKTSPRKKKLGKAAARVEEEAPSEPRSDTDDNNSDDLDEVESQMMTDILISVLAELETRPGVSKDSLDAAISITFTQIPALQCWFGAHVGKDVQRKVQDTLRRVVQEALDAWCSSGDVEMVGLQGGGTPPSLFHVQITPEKGVSTVENAVFAMKKLVDDAARDISIILQQRGVPFSSSKVKSSKTFASDDDRVWRKSLNLDGKAGVLPVFEDRGTLTARVVPMGGVAVQQLGLNAAAAAAVAEKLTTKKKKKKKKKVVDEDDDEVIDLTHDDPVDEEVEVLLPKKKKRKNEATTTTTLTPGESSEAILTRNQQKLAAMRDKLGLPQNCGLTRAELRELVKEANKEKQRLREEEIQAAKAVKQRAAALMALPAAAEDAGAAGASKKATVSAKTTTNIKLTPLHLEIAELARQATPTPSEIAIVKAAVHAVNSAARGLWPAARAVLFGSQATGLALPGGDLDIVVLGVGPQLQRAASGFTVGQRRELGDLLEDLLDALRRNGTLLSSVQIIDAKIPIIKCLIQTSRTGPALPADISFGAVNGAAAVAFLRRQILAVPPLRPLSLAVKAFLRDRGLNEVFTGGIGSYAVVNMVLAHLQREGFQADITQADKLGLSRSSLLNNNKNCGGDATVIAYGDKETFAYLEKLVENANNRGTAPTSGSKRRNSTGNLPASAASTTYSDDVGPHDYGLLLWGFLTRFSQAFDFLSQAISIRQGGFVKKGRWRQTRRPWLLAVEDPQEPGKDICSGSFNIKHVREEFESAAQTLAEVSEDAEAHLLAAARSGSGGDGRGNTSSSSVTDKMPMLSLLMDVECAVGRTPAANAARRALEHEAEKARQAVKKRFEYLNGSTTQKRSRSSSGTGDSRGEKKRLKFVDDDDEFIPPILNMLMNKQQLQRQENAPPPQRQSQEKHTPKGSGGRGSQPRGSKGSRAVAAQWKDKKGQYLDFGDDGPDYRGGGGGGGSDGQESMQLQKYKSGRFSLKKQNRGKETQDSGGVLPYVAPKKKRKGIQRKLRNASTSKGTGGGGDLGVKKKKMKKKQAKKKSATPTTGGSAGGSGKKKTKKGGRAKSS